MFVVPDRPDKRVPICFSGSRSLANAVASYLQISADFDKARRLPIFRACSRTAQLQGFGAYWNENARPVAKTCTQMVHLVGAFIGFLP
tara:strand:- start:49 stop:312 length:264 start_codon:yes stop_codon:yes gene_type:complete